METFSLEIINHKIGIC